MGLKLNNMEHCPNCGGDPCVCREMYEAEKALGLHDCENCGLCLEDCECDLYYDDDDGDSFGDFNARIVESEDYDLPF